LLPGYQSEHFPMRNLLLARHRFVVNIHRHSDGAVTKQCLNDFGVAVILSK